MMKKKTCHLKKNKDFRKVYRHGNSFADRRLVIYVNKNSIMVGSRVGFSVSKKIGNAVVRNRIRRVLKEICRLNRSKIKNGYDIIFIAKTGILNATYRDLEKSFLWLIGKSGLLEEKK